jgi:hypothetical protein
MPSPPAKPHHIEKEVMPEVMPNYFSQMARMLKISIRDQIVF